MNQLTKVLTIKLNRMEKHYYLLNGTIKVSDIEYPTRNMFPKGEIGTVLYNDAFKEFNKYSKPCEIDESELDKVKDYFKNIDFWDESKIADITELIRVVNESYTHNGNILGKCSKIYFKQPTEKQVDSGIKKIAIEYSDKVNIEGATSSSISEALYGEKTDIDILKEKLSFEQRKNETLVYECNSLKQQLETFIVNANSLYPDNRFIEWAFENYTWFNGIWTSKWTDTCNPPEQKTTQQLIGLYINLPKTTNLT
jgi:hypothetical protein